MPEPIARPSLPGVTASSTTAALATRPYTACKTDWSQTCASSEIELRGSFRFHPEFATAVQFPNQELIDGKPVITRILPLAEAVAAFALAGDKSQSLKVQIAFGEAPTSLQPIPQTA